MTMKISTADVISELKRVRKGFGLEDARAAARIGPALRLLAGATGDDGPAVQRRKVKAFLQHTTKALPRHMAGVVVPALALDGADNLKFESRLHRMALQQGCDARTARRHVDDALTWLAEQALSAPQPPDFRTAQDLPWYVGRLKTLVLLKSPAVEVIEERHIISNQDDLREITLSYSLGQARNGVAPAASSPLQIDVLGGGVPLICEQLSATRTGVRIRLPRPLQRRQGHMVTVRVITEVMAPFYVCTPRYACRRFDLTVGFDRAHIPSRVWVIDNELPLEAGDPSCRRGRVRPNDAGEIVSSFEELEANRSYGLGWAWEAPDVEGLSLSPLGVEPGRST
ncbi:hypothetical protein [Spongiactinospora sp. 9N601]|uniref:hypothetical protein n=1 Tax=Spongiactinospora sp. 9N601 TaxID=3375149 RepID=UPI0037A697D4